MAKIVEMTNMRCIMRADEEKIWLIDCNKKAQLWRKIVIFAVESVKNSKSGCFIRKIVIVL